MVPCGYNAGVANQHPGTGKSSLIRAILQCCEHIVHVEPEKDAPSAAERADRGRPDTAEKRTKKPRISEVYASTMPRPPWWSPYDGEGGAECRDPAFVDTILDTNICFVDTPGHDSSFKVSRSPDIHSSEVGSDQIVVIGCYFFVS